jgi:hypothetical protein
MRVDKAVEPTRSVNHRDLPTLGGVLRFRLARHGLARGGTNKLDDRHQDLAPVPEREHADFFEVLVRQTAEDGKIDVIFDKAISVLFEAERAEPIGNLPHRRHLKPACPARAILLRPPRGTAFTKCRRLAYSRGIQAPFRGFT